MDTSIEAWLFDILNSINEIESYIVDGPNNVEEYKKDIKTKRAIERNIEIIGEAVNRIVKKHPDFPIRDSRNIIGARNRIIHNYDMISDEVVWSIVVDDLPHLKEDVFRFVK
jgi:uncharacterized protein with HEPN domain